MQLLPSISLVVIMAATVVTVLGACDVSFSMIDADKDEVFANLGNTDRNVSDHITIYSPCSINFVARVSMCNVSGPVWIQLRDVNATIVRSRFEANPPFALYGNSGADYFGGGMPGSGQHSIRARVNGVWSPANYFDYHGCCSRC